MKFRYTAIYSIKGIRLPLAQPEIDLIIDATNSVRTVLTTQPDAHLFEADRSLAVADLILRGLTQAQHTPAHVKTRIANAVEEIRTARKKEFGNNPFLIIIADGEVPTFSPSNEKDIEDFVLCFDGADKGAIREGLQPAISSIIACATSELEDVIAIKKVSDPVVFLRDDGKPVYSYTFSANANAYVSRPITDEQVRSIQRRYHAFATDNSLRRVQRLLKASFEMEEDDLRSFLATWSAFEIFVNKVFPGYEDKFWHIILEGDHSEVRKEYLEWIREVVKGKYPLANKFAAIAFLLSPESTGHDLKTVRQVKRIRDELSHGEPTDDAALPVKSIRDVTKKYLRLHLEQMRNPK